MGVRLDELINPDLEAKLRAAVADHPAAAAAAEDPPGDPEYKADTIGELEHKADPGLGGAQVLEADDATGRVVALVSVTGVEDRVKDIIEPGAYAKTLTRHEPIGVWSHDDKTWVARTESAVELMPGDPFFKDMKTMDGQPWPAAAGAVKVEALFNLETPHGAAAYSDVKFFKGKTGWSIGYRATKAHRNPRTGVRNIKELDWFEYSPVMVGAASQPMTLAVKSFAGAYAVDPDEAVGLVDDGVLEALSDSELARFDELKASLGLEVKAVTRRVRTAAGAKRYGQPIGSVIVKDSVSASDVKVGDVVDSLPGHSGASGRISKATTSGETTTLTVDPDSGAPKPYDVPAGAKVDVTRAQAGAPGAAARESLDDFTDAELEAYAKRQDELAATADSQQRSKTQNVAKAKAARAELARRKSAGGSGGGAAGSGGGSGDGDSGAKPKPADDGPPAGTPGGVADSYGVLSDSEKEAYREAIAAGHGPYTALAYADQPAAKRPPLKDVKPAAADKPAAAGPSKPATAEQLRGMTDAELAVEASYDPRYKRDSPSAVDDIIEKAIKAGRLENAIKLVDELEEDLARNGDPTGNLPDIIGELKRRQKAKADGKAAAAAPKPKKPTKADLRREYVGKTDDELRAIRDAAGSTQAMKDEATNALAKSQERRVRNAPRASSQRKPGKPNQATVEREAQGMIDASRLPADVKAKAQSLLNGGSYAALARLFAQHEETRQAAEDLREMAAAYGGPSRKAFDTGKLAYLNQRLAAAGSSEVDDLPLSVKGVDLTDADDFLVLALVEADPSVEVKGSSASLNRSPRSNWVEKAGELPAYVREVARSIEKTGRTLSEAIPIAIGRIKTWARGGGGVKPDTVAKAAKAVAEWEALKARSGKKYDSELLEHLETKALALIADVEAAYALLYEAGEFKDADLDDADDLALDADDLAGDPVDPEPAEGGVSLDELLAESKSLRHVPAPEGPAPAVLSADELAALDRLRAAI